MYEHQRGPLGGGYGVTVVLVAVSFGLAWLSWRFVERPMMRFKVPKSAAVFDLRDPAEARRSPAHPHVDGAPAVIGQPDQ